MENRRIAVLIPCYNEEMTVEKVVRDFRSELPGADIYVYDNNSVDRTAELAKKAGAIVVSEPRQGKGNAVRAMFSDVEADIYVMADGDDTYPADEVHKLIEPVLDGRADMVIGDRLSSTYFIENKRAFHNFGNRFVRSAINGLFHSDVRDIMTGYRAFNRLFVKNCPILSRNFEVETEMTIHALQKNFKVVEVPVTYRDRPEGSVSKLSTISDGIKVTLAISGLYRKYKPFAFFGAFALLLFIAAAALFIPVFIEYVNTGLVPRFPTLIASGVMATIAVVLLICGSILDVINHNFCQMYELWLKR